jgi:hypothetical protein
MLERDQLLENFSRPFACAFCGEDDVRPLHWYLLAENSWMNRVKILLWSDALACQPGILAVCCAEHVQELVAHWMAVGSLNYPFARVPGQRAAQKPAPVSVEPDTRQGTVVGELAIHRESLTRLLAENPQALAGMLDALVNALSKKMPGSVRQEELVEELAMC